MAGATKLRAKYFEFKQKQKHRKIDPNLKRNLNPGWLLTYLYPIETAAWGRWKYWALCQAMPQQALERWKFESALALAEGRKEKHPPDFVVEATLPDEPIPQIEWGRLSTEAETMLHSTLDCIPRSGSWLGYSATDYLNYFLDWALYGFGHPAYRELPKEPGRCVGASMRLYQLFDLTPLLLYPGDYMGGVVSDAIGKNGARGSGFFPTPIEISELIAKMIFAQEDNKFNRIAPINEPAVGTGSMLLTASNYSLCAIGQDINPLILKCALFQFYLYAPWYACPIWWLGKTDLLMGNSLAMELPESVNAKYWHELLLEENGCNEEKENKTYEETYYGTPEPKQAEPPPIVKEVMKGKNFKQKTLFDLGSF